MGEPAETGARTELLSRSVEDEERRPAKRQGSRTRLRMLYFSIAAAWGFVAGTFAILAALVATGAEPPAAGFTLALALGAAFLIAVAGGCYAARIYRQARGG